MNGLVIKPLWIERIMNVSKVWAIRGTRTNTRGRIALVRGSAGQIVGTCEIVDCIGPMSPVELRAAAEKQQAPAEMLMASAGTKAFAWVLSDVKALAEPISYEPAAGSRIWVKLTPENVPNRYDELAGEAPPAPKVELTIAPIVAELQAQAEPSPQAAASDTEAA